MKIDNFDVQIKDKLLIVTAPFNRDVTKEDLLEVKKLLENSTNYIFEYGLYRNIIGYYYGFDFVLNDSVNIGTLNLKVAIEMINTYKLLREHELKNSSNE